MELRKTFYIYNNNDFILFTVRNILFVTCLCCSYVSTDNCSYQAEVARAIDNIGFHRNIHYNFTLRTNCTVSKCNLCLQENIPSGLFVNKDQLNDLLRLDRLSAEVDGDVDIEAPERDSPSLIIKIFKELNLSTANSFIGNATLPVHLRYHDPQPGGGFRKFKIGQPELYIHCKDVPVYRSEGVYLTPCAGNEKEPLPYQKIPYKISKEDSNLVVQVPVGNSDLTTVVYAGTFGVAIAGTLYLAGVLYKI